MALIENNKLVSGGITGALIVGAALIMGGAFGHNFIPILVGSGVTAGGLVLTFLKVRHHWKKYQEKKNIEAVKDDKRQPNYCPITRGHNTGDYTFIGSSKLCNANGMRTPADRYATMSGGVFNGAGIGNNSL